MWSCDNCNSSSLADIAFEQSELKLKIAKLEKIRGKTGHNVRSSKSIQTELQLVFSETERYASVVKQSKLIATIAQKYQSQTIWNARIKMNLACRKR